ncbi:c-type cytochrome [Pseudomonadota bacterium]
MKLTTGVIGAALVAVPMMFSTAAVAADGKSLFGAKGCAGCHGPTGMGTVGPRLAGQQEKYIVEQFKLIRDGQRSSGKAGMMKGAVAAVKDDEIAAIASYLTGL